MRLQVAEIILQSLRSLDITYPNVDEIEKAKFAEYRQRSKRGLINSPLNPLNSSLCNFVWL